MLRLDFSKFYRYKPGDLILCQAGLLGHEVIEWKAKDAVEGMTACSPGRKAVVFFTHASVA